MKRFARAGLALTTALTGLTVVALSAPTASAKESLVCTPTSCTDTFTPSGGVQTFAVPQDVTSVDITVNGAAGGNITGLNDAQGGLGGTVAGTLAVTPGDTLTLVVGAAGQDMYYASSGAVASGGYGGGGDSGKSNILGAAAGGGGGSFLFDSGGTLLLAAGGGGGATYHRAGGSGGSATVTGGAGTNGTCGATGGAGGTLVTPGAGGTGGTTGCLGSAGNDATGFTVGPSTLAQGGKGGFGAFNGGGGGGGGFSGGGGGGGMSINSSYAGGGGGGAGFDNGTVTNPSGTPGNNAGDGSIILTWSPPAGPQTMTSFQKPTKPFVIGTHQKLHAVGDPVTGNPAIFSVDTTNTTNDACSVTGKKVNFLHFGTCVLLASQNGDGYWGAATPISQTIVIKKQGESVTMPSSTGSTLEAKVTSIPGLTLGTGTVKFFVNGTKVGKAEAVDGVASLPYSLKTGKDKVVKAKYLGSDELAASSGSFTQKNPKLKYDVTSDKKEKNGWYRKDVTVTFTCVEGSSPLNTGCPAPVVLNVDGESQKVHEKITADDGGSDSMTIHISVDETAPNVEIKGASDGDVFHVSLPTITCKVTDGLSGPDHCKITQTQAGNQVTIKAKGWDLAGNKTVKTITVTLKKS